MLREILKLNWQFLFLSLFAALIPSGLNYWPLGILWILLWLTSGEYKKFKLPKKAWFWIMSSFFILHFIGFLYSSNKSDGFDIAFVELGFLFFPIILNTHTLKKEEFSALLMIFSCANFIAAVFLILRSLFYTIALQCPVYMYSKFSPFVHPTYLSLYLIFSIVILYLGEFKLSGEPKKDVIIKLIMSSVMVLAVLFCSAKIGLITLAVSIIFMSAYFIIKLKKVYQALSFFFIISGICFVFTEFVAFPLQRLNNIVVQMNNTKGMNYTDLRTFNTQTVSKGLNQKESTIARVFIWGSALPVIKDHLLFGVGPGDVSNAMNSYAESKGIYTFDKYNMHNQYIETAMGLGIPGLIVLLLLTFGALIYAFIQRDLLMGVFTTLCILFFMVESMFRMNYFSLFFSLFLFLFIRVNTKKDTSPE
ncbi:MAG TPA: O-antigen ligase family protein [Bacteroidia bacterium]|jgi:O-antigen ligase|nr:O-antigen ligase family protein [Bacteroidia bacterium]